MNFKYFPLFYLTKIKRPNENYFFNQIISDDLLVIWLGISLGSPDPIRHAVSMIFLMLSLWCIYEIGYWENDQIGEKSEEKPILSDTYTIYKEKINVSWQPWACSLGLAIAGILHLELSDLDIFGFNQIWINQKILSKSGYYLFIWLLLMMFIRASFWFYNHVDIKTRVWIFPFLQATKCFGFLLITSTNIIGSILFFSQVFSRWLPYLIYRYEGNRQNFPKRLSRLFLFIFLTASISFSEFDTLVAWRLQLLVILIILALRSLKEGLQILQSMKFVS